MKNLVKKSKQRKQSDEQNESNNQKQNTKEQQRQQSPYYNDESNMDFTKFQPRIQTIQQQQKIETIEKQPRPQQIQTSMLEYKLQKLLLQSQKREQAYQQYIKKKHQQSYGLTQSYIQTLKKYKEQLDNFIQQRNKKKQSKFQVYQANKVFSNEYKPINKYKKLKLTPSHKQERQGHKIDLQCKITVKFICPLVQDYLKEKFPQNLDIKLELPIKRKFLHMADKSNQILQVSIKMQDDEDENIDNLINGYPFSLVPSGNKNGRKFNANQGETLSHQFRILNEAPNIEDLQKGKMQIKVIDRDSKMLWAYSSLSTQRLLYYSEQSTINSPVETMQTEILQLYSPYSHQNNSILHLRQFYQIIFQVHTYVSDLEYKPRRFTLKDQVTEFSRLGRWNWQRSMQKGIFMVTSNLSIKKKRQSRQLQRINKFKSTAYSLTMRPDVDVFNKDADKQKMFQKSNDKNLINYRRMKELQTISNYKEKQKSQYVETLFDQALTKFSLQQVEMGVPKYLVFYYEKQKSQPEKIFLKSQIKVNGLKQGNAQDVLKQVETKMMTKQEVEFLIQKGVVKIKSDCYIDVQGTQKQGFYVFDNKIAFVYKMIIYPNSKLSHLIQHNEDESLGQKPDTGKENVPNKLRFQVLTKMYSQVGELLSQQVYNVQPVHAACNFEMSFHNYELAQQQIDIPLGSNIQSDSEQEKIDKNIRVIGSENLVYKINRQRDTLQIKVKYHKLSQNINKNNTNKRCLFIALLDSRSNLCYSKYKINLYSYHKMNMIQNYQLGQIAKYKFQFNIDQQVNRLLETKNNGSQMNSKINKSNLRVGMFTSHPNQTVSLCNGKQQLVINSNQTYQIEVVYQSFFMNSQDRVICHVLDLDSNVVIKKWLLKIQKNPAQFKSINQFKVSFNKQIKYPYFLKNKSGKQTSFKLFTSNFSILTVPESAIQLSPNQQVSVDLKVIVRRQNFSAEQKQKGINVIVRVQDILTKDGWNQLFKIFLD